MSSKILYEGWLTKSPPTKRIWRTKWRKRWFALRNSTDRPGHYFIEYYADRNYRRLKGSIDLESCEQVDAGLRIERNGNNTLDHNGRGSVFTIQTTTRIYHLEAECEEEMEKWVDAICKVCGFRATAVATEGENNYQNTPVVTATNDHYENTVTTGPYIPISECITGVRDQDEHRAFLFDPRRNRHSRTTLERVHEMLNITSSYKDCPPMRPVPDTPLTKTGAAANKTGPQMRRSPVNNCPQITITPPDPIENNANTSEDNRSINTSQLYVRGLSVSRSLKKLSLYPQPVVEETGPPVPPRPPKTLGFCDESMFCTEPVPEIITPYQWYHRQWQGAPPSPGRSLNASFRYGEEEETNIGNTHFQWHHRQWQGAPSSPGRSLSASFRYTDEEETNLGNMSIQYCNVPLPALPPAVNRNLKPHRSSHSIGHIGQLPGSVAQVDLQLANLRREMKESKAQALQYLDLDLPNKTQPPNGDDATPNGKPDIIHGLSKQAQDSDYKTVDFLKTEAFNITRQDQEAARSYQ